ncbi:hypothetical protein [Ulvibacterium marinum]|uniref:DUF4105 domain-containing protein n=1 Tax=Ulvibacterium marinum TaxID=2419782 RepID=A0A3B0CC37_9FLAO|nr:hypothetical protein [Ulvibacterium marinum]RKN81187.1 hypothetical protein D7Z94_09605 [Ulvibacterium marinum]
MNRIFKRQMLVVILLCAIYPLTAQKKSFHTGYIIAQNGDTIPGLVKDRSPEPFVSLFNKIRFKEAGRSRTKKYGPNDILGYGYQGQHFVSMPFQEESTFFKFRYYTDKTAPSVFLKVIRQSEGLIYFEYLFVHDDNSYLDAFPLFYRPGDPEMVRVTQGIFGFKKKQLATYFSDCPALTEELFADKTAIRTVPELYEFCLVHCIP